MLKIIDEFKTFISRGNALDMAVWVIIGASFWTIVNSLVNDIIMPPLWILIGGVDFSDLKFTLKDAVIDSANNITPAVTINYWTFINNIVSFLIIMFSIFIMLKVVNKIFHAKEQKAEKPKATKDQELLTEIRDILKNENTKKTKA